jgi:membrane protein DedA with SNARE-associated domain
MFYMFLAGVSLFLLGFYCGRIWVTRLEGKTVSMKTVCIAVFVVMVLAVGILSFPLKSQKSPAVEVTTESAADTVPAIK